MTVSLHERMLHQYLPAKLTLSQLDSEVHVWRYVDEPRDRATFESALTPSERRMAENVDAGAAWSFLARRGFLRILLSKYLHQLPASLPIEPDNFGRLSMKFSRTGLDFSIASSNSVTLVAVTRGRRIGVDIEDMNVDFDYWSVADYFLTPSEISFLRCLQPGDSKKAFFRYWTRKEAFSKATSRVHASPLSIEVPLMEGGPLTLLRADRREHLAGWQLAELPVDSSFAAALAVQGHDWVLRTMWLETPATAEAIFTC
jgi:4'-phosphopantetheinyl transferase